MTPKQSFDKIEESDLVRLEAARKGFDPVLADIDRITLPQDDGTLSVMLSSRTGDEAYQIIESESGDGLEVLELQYGQKETTVISGGALETLEPVDLGRDPSDLEAGDDVEHWNGNRYRVVVPPGEREYDDKALCYPLDSPSNACTKIAPERLRWGQR